MRKSTKVCFDNPVFIMLLTARKLMVYEKYCGTIYTTKVGVTYDNGKPKTSMNDFPYSKIVCHITNSPR